MWITVDFGYFLGWKFRQRRDIVGIHPFGCTHARAASLHRLEAVHLAPIRYFPRVIDTGRYLGYW